MMTVSVVVFVGLDDGDDDVGDDDDVGEDVVGDDDVDDDDVGDVMLLMMMLVMIMLVMIMLVMTIPGTCMMIFCFSALPTPACSRALKKTSRIEIVISAHLLSTLIATSMIHLQWQSPTTPTPIQNQKHQ